MAGLIANFADRATDTNRHKHIQGHTKYCLSPTRKGIQNNYMLFASSAPGATGYRRITPHSMLQIIKEPQSRLQGEVAVHILCQPTLVLCFCLFHFITLHMLKLLPNAKYFPEKWTSVLKFECNKIWGRGRGVTHIQIFSDKGRGGVGPFLILADKGS